MDSMFAFVLGEMNRHKELMVFDWDKAAEIIKERKATSAIAGLQNDLEWTGGHILDGGKPIADSYTYLSSTWAMPVLILDDEYEDEIPCFKMEHETAYTCDTKWPNSALNILGLTKEDFVCKE